MSDFLSDDRVLDDIISEALFRTKFLFRPLKDLQILYRYDRTIADRVYWDVCRALPEGKMFVAFGRFVYSVSIPSSFPLHAPEIRIEVGAIHNKKSEPFVDPETGILCYKERERSVGQPLVKYLIWAESMINKLYGHQTATKHIELITKMNEQKNKNLHLVQLKEFSWDILCNIGKQLRYHRAIYSEDRKLVLGFLRICGVHPAIVGCLIVSYHSNFGRYTLKN